MAIFMIAKIMNGNNLIGIRLLDTEERRTVDTSIESLRVAISRGIKIENLEIVNSELTGINGSLYRYTSMDLKLKLTNIPAIVIINKIGNIGYTVADYTGAIKEMTDTGILDLLQYKNLRIANGKVVNKAGGKVISAIEGEYKTAGVILKNTYVGISSRAEVIKNVANHKYDIWEVDIEHPSIHPSVLYWKYLAFFSQREVTEYWRRGIETVFNCKLTIAEENNFNSIGYKYYRYYNDGDINFDCVKAGKRLLVEARCNNKNLNHLNYVHAFYEVKLTDILRNWQEKYSIFTKENDRYYSVSDTEIKLDRLDRVGDTKVALYDKYSKEVITKTKLEVVEMLATGTYINGFSTDGYKNQICKLERTYSIEK